MDSITKYLNKIAYKFPKGYPDMNNDQDVLLLESILSEIGFPIDLNEVSEEDSPNLPDNIIQLKQDIQSISGLDNVTTVKTGGGKNYSFYVKGVGDRDRKERREIGKKITQNLPKKYIISDNNFSNEDIGPAFNVTIDGVKYKINIKGLGSSPFDTDTDQKEGLVILMYNILNSGKNLQPFNQETISSNVDILNDSIDNSSLFKGIDGKALGAIKSLLKILNNSDLEKFPVNKFKNFNNPYSIASKVNQDYPGEEFIRDGVFNEIRAMGQQICKIPADKWNPGDIYIKIKNPPQIPDTLEGLNGLFVNNWGGKDNDLVSISLKESSSQPGRAKSYFANFKGDDGKLRDQEYNLTKDELGWSIETAKENTQIQQDKFLNKVQGEDIKLSGDGWNKLPEDLKQLIATYGSFKLMNFLLDNSKRNNSRDAILDLVSYGLSLSGVNPTFFKLKGNNDGSPSSDPTIFPAGSTTSHNSDPEIINSSKAGGFQLKTDINTVQGGEITDTKKYSHRFRTSGGNQISIV
tara:strand:- start:6936 stop:8498 length:1563 start_codon:yes stop_codon:yes gene_type:complete